MGVEERDDGKFVAGDGSVHEFHSTASLADQNRQASGGGVSSAGGGFIGGATGAGAGVLMWIILFGPLLIAKVGGFIWGLLFNLAVVGRVIQSVIFGLFVGSFPVFILLEKYFLKYNVLRFAPLDQWLQYITFGFIGWGLTALIYFYFIYPVWVRMEQSDFSNMLKNVTMFTWFGAIAYFLVSFFSGSNKPNIFFIGLIASIVYYIIKTIPYTKDAWVKRKELSKAPIAALIALVLTCGLPFIVLAGERAKTSKRVDESLNSYSIGTDILVRGEYMGTQKLYENADDESNVLTTIPVNTKLTIIGEPVQYWGSLFYLPVEYQGIKGWIDSHKAFAISGTGTIIEDIRVTVDNSYVNYPGYEKRGLENTVPLNKGVTVYIQDYVNDKKNKEEYYYVAYNGIFASIKPEYLEVSSELKKQLGVK